MKTFFTISILCASILTIQAQRPTTSGEYSSYTTRDSVTIKPGDKFEFGIPRNGNRFAYISQVDYLTDKYTGDLGTIKKLKSHGNKKHGYKMYAIVKGYGITPITIHLEPAIKSKEIILVEH